MIDPETLFVIKVVGGAITGALIGLAIWYQKHVRKKPTEGLQGVLGDPRAWRDYRLVLLELRERGQPIDHAMPALLAMMLSDDLGKRRLAKNLMHEFFPRRLDGIRYNWLLPSKKAREQLTALARDCGRTVTPGRLAAAASSGGGRSGRIS